jgi:mannose-6-phosphate isomerase-like protein (cupin superfamily)
MYEEYCRVELLTDAAEIKKRDNNSFSFFKQLVKAPARLSGNVLLAHETMNQVKEPRRAWIYNSGQRRVRLAPQVAYDGPGTAADGLRTTDNFDMYNGATDRYNWKIVGKKEIYIPYNSYKLEDKKLKYKDVVHAGHLNPELPRYELHRVWVVEGVLKEGQRHIYAKRIFYVDEDSWYINVADHYDGRGEIWRVAEGHINMRYKHDDTLEYAGIMGMGAVEAIHDLQNGRYIALGLTNEIKESDGYKEFSSADFTPAALRRMGR